jgi:hypothetical protein
MKAEGIDTETSHALDELEQSLKADGSRQRSNAGIYALNSLYLIVCLA